MRLYEFNDIGFAVTTNTSCVLELNSDGTITGAPTGTILHPHCWPVKDFGDRVKVNCTGSDVYGVTDPTHHTTLELVENFTLEKLLAHLSKSHDSAVAVIGLHVITPKSPMEALVAAVGTIVGGQLGPHLSEVYFGIRAPYQSTSFTVHWDSLSSSVMKVTGYGDRIVLFGADDKQIMTYELSAIKDPKLLPFTLKSESSKRYLGSAQRSLTTSLASDLSDTSRGSGYKQLSDYA